MNTSIIEAQKPEASEVKITDDSLSVNLNDGRTITVPLVWFPRLLEATRDELENYRFIGNGEGIHWDDLDEDISIWGLLLGRKSGESQASLKKWLDARS